MKPEIFSKYFLTLFLVIIGCMTVGAVYAADLDFTNDTDIVLGGHTYVISAGSQATSLVVDASTVTLTVPSSSSLTFVSADKHALSNDQGIREICTNSQNSIHILGPVTVIITPNPNSTCRINNIRYSGSRGAVSKPPSAPLPVALPIVPVPVSQYAFGTGVVKLGTRGEACKAWQKFFNDKAGTHLIVDGVCGKLSIAAAKAWQAKAGLQADGLLGPMSRAKANTY